MGVPFQRKGGVSPRYDLHPEEALSAEEAAARAAEYIAYENERWRRIEAEQDRADRIAKTVRWFSSDGAMAPGERSFHETYGFEPEWP
ncbi:MAG: hypothetical protein KA139_07640 [Rhodobacteraceae bacterium]|nr:hypothetical protein [Paracoccaceae bacterium]